MKHNHASQFNEHEHRALAIWAADCAGRVLAYFEMIHPEDDRPRNAIESARAWERGELSIVMARKAAFAGHAAARTADTPAAQAAARSAAHAAATAHVAGHARHAAAYAVKAVAAEAGEAAAGRERDWQVSDLPERLRPKIFSESAPV